MWQLAEAKNKLSEVIELAIHKGPQRISRRGSAVAVVISVEDFERMAGERPSLIDYLSQGPSFDGLDLERNPSPSRDVEL